MRPEGFAPIPTWMLRDKSISRRACLVYASLSSRSGLGAIYPSQETIAAESGVSVRTVRAALTELEDLGVVERRTRRGREGRANGLTTAYVLHPNGRFGEPADIAGRSERPATSDRATGKTEQTTPLIEAENQEASLSPDESGDLGTLIPDEWRPNQKHIDKAASLRLDVKNEYQRFRAHAERTHRRLKNWNAGFTNWLRKTAEMNQQRGGAPVRQTFAQQQQDNSLALVERLREKEQHEAVGSGAVARVRELGRGPGDDGTAGSRVA